MDDRLPDETEVQVNLTVHQASELLLIVEIEELRLLREAKQQTGPARDSYRREARTAREIATRLENALHPL